MSLGNIVVVEPDDLIRELLGRWLSDAGYEVKMPLNDPEAAMVKFGLVIADISNPGSAQATIAELRDAYAAPVLVLSARFRSGLGGSSEAAQRIGAVKVLPKPFTREELLTAVRAAMGKL